MPGMALDSFTCALHTAFLLLILLLPRCVASVDCAGNNSFPGKLELHVDVYATGDRLAVNELLDIAN